MAMVRKQIYIEESQNLELKRLAEKLGVSEAEVIRRAIVAVKSEVEKAEEVTYRMKEQYLRIADRDVDDRLGWSRADMYKDYPRRLDDTAWAEELAFIDEIGKTATGNKEPLTWSREDSYDNRRLRLPD
jgi:hypothetical protein